MMRSMVRGSGWLRWSGVRGPVWLSVLALFSAALLIGACDDELDPTGDDDASTINVTVRADGETRQGVTVRLFAAGSASEVGTKQTDTNGVAAFGGLTEAGTYEAEIDVPAGLLLADGEVARKSVAVAEGGTAAVSFDLVAEEGGSDVVEIHLTSGRQFDPSEVTISVGTTVRWITDTDDFHTITPSGHAEWVRQEMDTTGQTFEHTFNTAGTFDYICEPHESVGMVGTITVQ